MPRSSVQRVAGAVVASAVLLVACTSSSAESVDLEGVESGPCGEFVNALEDVDAGLQEVADEDITPREAATRFQAAQEVLKPAVATAEAPVAESITELVTRLGFFRISVDSNNYDGAEDAKVRNALRALAEDCRAS